MPKAPKKEVKKASKKVVKKVVAKPVKKATAKTTTKVAPKTTKKVAPKTTKKVAIKTTKKVAIKVTKKAATKSPKKTVKAVVKKVKEVAKEAKAPVLKIKDAAIKNLVESIVGGMQNIKGKDIVVLDLTELPNAVTDYFVIATGDSSTQVEGMASSVVRKTRTELRERPWHEEGVGNSEWILLDYVNVVVHIFYRETREFYNLEDLWADAKRTDFANLS